MASAYKKPVIAKKPVVSRTPSKGVKVTMPKTLGTTAIKKPMPKLVGPAAIKEIQRQVSPAGVKQSEKKQRNAIDKKYPGLYKSGK